MFFNLVSLINDGVITEENLDGFSDELVEYDTFPIFELQEAYAIIGEEKTYDEVGELYCESMGEIYILNAILLKKEG